MALSQTYYDAVNRSLDDVSTALRSHAAWWFNLIGAATQTLSGFTNGPAGAPPAGAAWVMDSSSNGTVAGSGNKFSATFVAAEWVRAAAGSAHSWFVLKHTGLGVYLLVSLGTASDQNAIVSLFLSAPTGGTTTADPTGTGAAYASAQVHPATTGAKHAHFSFAADGTFFGVCSTDSAARGFYMIAVQTLTEVRAGDAHPTIMYQNFLDSGRGPFWQQTNVGTNNAFNWKGFTPAGTADTAGTFLLVTTTNGQNSAGGQSGGADALLVQKNQQDSLIDEMPILYVFHSVSGAIGVKGRFKDVFYIGQQVPVGTMSPVSSPNLIALGSHAFPFSTALSM